MKNLTALTTEQTKRVKAEITNTFKSLTKELCYSKDLQNENRIAELKQHILKLENMAINGWNAPKFS